MSGADIRGWFDVLIGVGLIVMAVDRWVHRRESTEQSTAVELANVRQEVKAVSVLVVAADKDGQANAKLLGKLETELEMRAESMGKDHARFDREIAENARRIDELYRVMKRNGGAST